MARVAIALGSNLGARDALIETALRALERCGRVVSLSPLKKNRPFGPISKQPEFVNAVLLLQTDLAPEELLVACQKIEASLGRVRTGATPQGPRTIDLDLVLWLDEAGKQLDFHSSKLTLPHPALRERAIWRELLETLCDPVVTATFGTAPQLVSGDAR